MYVKRNIEAPSHKNFCHGKLINITYSSVSVRERMRVRIRVHGRVRTCNLTYSVCYAYAPYCDVICGPTGSTTFLVIRFIS